MILFLDFDGVLHPQYEGQAVPEDVAFCQLPRFDAVMRDFLQVEIVISSTWREQFSLGNLRSRFATDIASRISGTTLLSCRAPTPPLAELHARREWEITSWLRVQGRLGEPWVALDDAVWQFRHYHDCLVVCQSHVGFDAEAALRLRGALSAVAGSGSMRRQIA